MFKTAFGLPLPFCTSLFQAIMDEDHCLTCLVLDYEVILFVSLKISYFQHVSYNRFQLREPMKTKPIDFGRIQKHLVLQIFTQISHVYLVRYRSNSIS